MAGRITGPAAEATAPAVWKGNGAGGGSLFGRDPERAGPGRRAAGCALRPGGQTGWYASESRGVGLPDRSSVMMRAVSSRTAAATASTHASPGDTCRGARPERFREKNSRGRSGRGSAARKGYRSQRATARKRRSWPRLSMTKARSWGGGRRFVSRLSFAPLGTTQGNAGDYPCSFRVSACLPSRGRLQGRGRPSTLLVSFSGRHAPP